MALNNRRDPYEILGIDHTASEEEIKAAYRKLAKQYHPDSNPDDSAAAEKMNQINAAYHALRTMNGDEEMPDDFDFSGYSNKNANAPEEYYQSFFSFFYRPVFRRVMLLAIVVSMILVTLAGAFLQGYGM